MNEAEVISDINRMPKVLLVEDEDSGDELTTALEGEGIDVVLAKTAAEANEISKQNGFEVALLDILLKGEEQNGIDLAELILRDHPHCSAIFLSAYASDPDYDYRARAEEAHLRIADWLDKPIVPRLGRLVTLIGKEAKKVHLRKALYQAMKQEPAAPLMDHLLRLTSQLPALLTLIAPDLLEELIAEGKMDNNDAIDYLYSEIEKLVGQSPQKRKEARSLGDLLVRQLRDLQEREVREMERRFASHLALKPGEGYRLLDQARRLVER